jgi:hypothetical protein
MQQYLPTPPSQQILPLPIVASTPGSSHASAPSGAYCLYGGPIPSTTLTPSSTMFSGPSSSTGIPRAYALPSASAAHNGDVMTGTISIDSFDAFILFDSGASFSFISISSYHLMFHEDNIFTCTFWQRCDFCRECYEVLFFLVIPSIP